jgi:GNAT superfamily N-acetyltransferase
MRGRPRDGTVVAMTTTLPTLVAGVVATPEHTEAVDVLARGVRDHATHVRVFGSEPEHREHALALVYTALLTDRRAEVVGVRRDGRLVAASYARLPSRSEASPVLGAVVGLGSAALVRVARWMAAREQLRPAVPHLELGPLAVAPKARGLGAEAALLAEQRARLDRLGATGFAIAERPDDVEAHLDEGFVISAEAELLDVPVWALTRPARS